MAYRHFIPVEKYPAMDKGENFHQHRTINGSLVACYHTCKKWGWKGFVFGLTVGFLPEHFLWEKVPPFSYITHWVGL